MAATVAIWSVAVAERAFAQPEPGGPHPRLFLDAATDEALRTLAKQRGSSVARAVGGCDAVAGARGQHDRDSYMGFDWARSVQTCLIAWKVTGSEKHAATALRYFRALLDDRQQVGDGLGGDRSAARDDGYAIRAHGPYSALAYDWLHDHPLMDEATRARARRRFTAWTDWYLAEGYRARGPGTNYHAGYVLAATLIAIAQGTEAGEDGARLWRHVVDTVFGTDLLPAATDGVLVGGDWGEGWQYGPLSVVSYAMAARAIAAHGVDVQPMTGWLRDVVLRHIYAMTPAGDRTYVVGDTQAESAYLPLRRETLLAVLLGPAPLTAKRWARAELDRVDRSADAVDFPILDVLAESSGVTAEPFPRAAASTAYLARGTGIVYARSSWGPAPMWFVARCSKTLDVDHTPANAGNFALSRGDDDLIVDPSPYGSLSSLTSNTPTIESLVAPPHYVPSQAYWSHDSGYRWLGSIGDGTVVARCDYADHYRIQETASDIPLAYRDFLFLPYEDGSRRASAALVVLDRATAGTPAQKLHLRFRTEAKLKLQGDVASATRGRSALTIRRLAASGGAAEVRSPASRNCFDGSHTRGNCDASRFAVTELRLVVPGPDPLAVHLVDAAAAGATLPAARALTATGGAAWLVERGGRRWTVAAASATTPLDYVAPAGATHVVVPAAAGGPEHVRVASVAEAGLCRITVGAATGTEVAGAPALFAVGPDCAVTAMTLRPIAAGADAVPPQ
jgi:hypothetical protein